MNKEKAIKLIQSLNREDIILGLSLLIHNIDKEEFTSIIIREFYNIDFNTSSRLYCFKAYNTLWKITTGDKYILVFETTQTKESCISIGYEYIEL